MYPEYYIQFDIYVVSIERSRVGSSAARSTRAAGDRLAGDLHDRKGSKYLPYRSEWPLFDGRRSRPGVGTIAGDTEFRTDSDRDRDLDLDLPSAAGREARRKDMAEKDSSERLGGEGEEETTPREGDNDGPRRVSVGHFPC